MAGYIRQELRNKLMTTREDLVIDITVFEKDTRLFKIVREIRICDVTHRYRYDEALRTNEDADEIGQISMGEEERERESDIYLHYSYFSRDLQAIGAE